jgi:DNA-binding MarR family transcriptional regulator
MKKRPDHAQRHEKSEKPAWTFLTNHAHVLLCIAGDPQARIRDLAERVGITERAVQRIIFELEDAGYVTHEREGRRNIYRVLPHLPLRHPVEQNSKVAALLALAGE